MDHTLFGSDLWQPALDKYTEATGLSVELFDAAGRRVLDPVHSTPLAALFRECGFEPGLFAECARRCVDQTTDRSAVAVAEAHGLTVVGTSLVLEGAIVGAAVAGYALAGFPSIPSVQLWASSAGLPFDRLWRIVRRQPPVPERRLKLHGELLQVLGDALLRENHRTRQYEGAVLKLEEALVKLKAASAAKDHEFLSMLSHELRTPLAPILVWAGVLKKNESSERVRHAAGVIERNARHQSRMVDDLLDMHRITHDTVKLDFRVLEVSALVRVAMETSAVAADKKAIRLELADSGEPLFVEGDASRLHQVLGNVLSNAAKFTPRDGSIRVTVKREAQNALVVVTDTGKGIAPEFLPFVFDLFRQQDQGTRREHEGLGIGLALVKWFTVLHKGTVDIASAGAGCGAEVSIRLPLVAHTHEAAAAPGAEPSTSSLAGVRVLVLDDVQDARETLQILLEDQGAQVSVAGSAGEALDMLRRVDVDLVLCDLQMPRIDGYEFIRELHRGSLPACPPVLAVSAHASDADRRRTREAGFAAHIKKPFDEGAVVSEIGAVLSQQ